MIAVTGQFFHHIGSGLEPGDGEGTIFQCAVGADNGAARAGGAGQVFNLKKAALHWLPTDPIIFIHHKGGQGGVLHLDGLCLASGQIELVVRLLDGVPGGGFQLGNFEPAGVGMLKHDLSRLVGVEDAQVVVLACFGVSGGPPDLEFGLGHGVLCDAVHLQELEGGLDQVGQFDGGGAVFLQLNHVNGIVQHIIRGRLHLGNFVRAGPDAILGLQHNQAVLIGLTAIREAAADLLNQKGGLADRPPRLPVQFQQPQSGPGAVDKIRCHVLILGGVDPDRPAVVGIQDPRGWDKRFLNFKAAAGHIGEGGLSVCACDYIVFIADVHAPDMKGGVGNGIAALHVPFLDGEGTLAVVGLGDNDGLFALQILGIHINTHRGGILVEPIRRVNLPKFVIAFHHVADGDGAVCLGFLGADDLAVPEDNKNRASQGIAALVHLLQLDPNLGTVLKNEAYIVLTVPDKGLLHLGHVGTEQEAPGRGDFLRDVTAQGQGFKVQILFGDIAAVLGDVLPEEAAALVQLHRGNADKRAGDALGGVVRVYLADGTLAIAAASTATIGSVVEGNGGVRLLVGQDRDDLGFGLGHIAGGKQFCDFILAGR